MGVVLLRPGADLMPMFRRGRVLIEPAPEKYSDYATGVIPPATQPLAEDPVLKPVFENKDVILRAGGISSLEAELERGLNASTRTVRGTAKILRCSGMSLAASAFAGPAITWYVISTQRRWQALRVRTWYPG
jgi:hypothetical protein